MQAQAGVASCPGHNSPLQSHKPSGRPATGIPLPPKWPSLHLDLFPLYVANANLSSVSVTSLASLCTGPSQLSSFHFTKWWV